MERRFLGVVFLLLSVGFLAAQEPLRFSRTQVYDPFYDVEVELADGEVIVLTAAAFHNMEDQFKYFFWIRRGTGTGVVTYALELNRIREILFTDVYGTPENDFTPASLTLTNGQNYDVFMDTLGYLGGFDPAFGSYARIFLHYNLIRRITFKQDGSYQLCPHCGTVFYATGLLECPFDETPLMPDENSLRQNQLTE